MISDFEVRFEQTGVKAYQMVAYMDHVFIAHEIDELQDPYCLSNLLVFAQALGGDEACWPVGKLYNKHWRPFAPSWIAYETERCFTWRIRGLRSDDDSAELLIKSGLPYQTKAKTKISLRIHAGALASAIRLGLGLKPATYSPDTA